MSGKATVVAPSNIALIKYWGVRDPERAIPWNPSLSMTLRRCTTRTTVAGREAGAADEVLLRTAAGLEPATPPFAARVVAHLDRLREWAAVGTPFRVATENSFPMGSGLASSASGFAALALAFAAALEREVSLRQASLLAWSSGSGSAARSVAGGFVQWPATGDEDNAAAQLLPESHWDLRDVIAVVDASAKEVPSREGHRLASTSPYFERRLAALVERLRRVRIALEQRDFAALAPLVEEEAVDLHLIAMSSRPPIFYWRPATLGVLERVRHLRRAGIEVCATMDAGANVHLICTPAAEPFVAQELRRLPQVQEVIRDRVGPGPERVNDHLF